ncbi:MAG: GNAT family N-acetyltransferase [Calditrichia bacterium]
MDFSSYKEAEKTEIRRLFHDVFSQSEGPSEGALIAKLVLDLINTTTTPDIFGFVAKDEEKLIGSIFFTRLSFDTQIEAFILSPVAVHSDYQSKGIGQKLITHGLEQLKNAGVELAFTYGDPNYYSKVGFQQVSEEIIQAPLKMSQPEGWLCQSLVGNEILPIQDKPRCVPALNDPVYW